MTSDERVVLKLPKRHPEQNPDARARGTRPSEVYPLAPHDATRGMFAATPSALRAHARARPWCVRERSRAVGAGR